MKLTDVSGKAILAMLEKNNHIAKIDLSYIELNVEIEVNILNKLSKRSK